MDMSYPTHIAFLALEYACQYLAKHDFGHDRRKALDYFLGNAAESINSDMGQMDRTIKEHIAIALGRRLNCGECKHVKILTGVIEDAKTRTGILKYAIPKPQCSCRFIHQATKWGLENSPTFPDAYACNLFEWEMKICGRCRHLIWKVERESLQEVGYQCAKHGKIVERKDWCDCDSWALPPQQSADYFERNCETWTPIADVLPYLVVEESEMDLQTNEFVSTNGMPADMEFTTHEQRVEGRIRAWIQVGGGQTYKSIDKTDGRLMWAMHHGFLFQVHRSVREMEEIYDFDFRFTNDSARGAGFIFSGGRI